MTPHSALVNAIRLACSHGATRLFVNPRGVAVYDGGARVEYGLAPGASDLIGWHRGRFVAIEVKVGRDRVRADQVAFIAAVIAAGGRAGVARSVEDAREILDRGVCGERI